MKSIKVYVSIIVLIMSWLALAAACTQPAVEEAGSGEEVQTEGDAPATESEEAAGESEEMAEPEEEEATSSESEGGEVKVGVLLPYTGIAAAVAPAIESGVQYAFAEKDMEVAGNEITLIFEDETDDPTVSVNKARKLVEQDEVDVILGPQLAHTAAAVSAYLTPLGVPHLVLGTGDTPQSDHTFYPGTGRGDMYVTGLFAYDELGAETAAILYQDYLFGQQARDGFTAGFTERGGEVVSEQGVPFGTADMAPFLEGVGDVDVLGVLLVNPSDFAFVRQFREFGLEMPVIFISNAPQEAPLLAEMGNDVVGMYGSSWYSPQIDTPANHEFVAGYAEAYGFPPGIATHTAYMAAAIYIHALEQTGGDPSYGKIIEAIENIENFENPAGTITMGPAHVAVHDQFVFQVSKEGERYVWDVVKQYSAVEPR